MPLVRIEITAHDYRSGLEILPQFQIRVISLGPQTALVTGTFSRVDGIAVDHRGWLFVSESESSIADIVTLEGNVADLDVPNWSMADHLHEGATLPWLDSRWQARDLAFLLDQTTEWQRGQVQRNRCRGVRKENLENGSVRGSRNS